MPHIWKEVNAPEDLPGSKESNHPGMDKDPHLGMGGPTMNTTVRIQKETALALKGEAITKRETYDEILIRLLKKKSGV